MEEGRADVGDSILGGDVEVALDAGIEAAVCGGVRPGVYVPALVVIYIRLWVGRGEIGKW